MRRVLITGSRDLTDRNIVYEALRVQAKIAGELDRLTVIHGDARGADTLAHQWCMHFPDVTEERYPADWDTHGKAAGHIRNGVMVRAGADVVLAFPRGEARGTMGCVAYAKKAGIPVIFG